MDGSIPPAQMLKDDWRYDFFNPMSQAENESDERYPNSAIDQIHYDMRNPKRAPWISTASLEKECPGEIEGLDFLTARQKQIIQMRCEGRSFEKIGNHLGITKQAVHSCLGRAQVSTKKNLDEFRRVMNSSLPEGVDGYSNDRSTFFFG